MAEKDQKPLRLKATDLKDLQVIAAILQDALVPIGDIAYLADEKKFVMALNRFRWEAEASDGEVRERTHERVHAGLCFETVTGVRYRGIDRRKRSGFLELLTIACDDGKVALHFAGDATIRLEVEKLCCALGDLGDPWPTIWKPRHDVL